MDGDFDDEGQPAKKISPRAGVIGRVSEERLRELMFHTDLSAEIQNTLPVLTPIILKKIEAIPSRRI